MTLGRYLLRAIYPEQEKQRMALRRMMSEIEACAEDITRTIRKDMKAQNVKMNGTKKDM